MRLPPAAAVPGLCTTLGFAPSNPCEAAAACLRPASMKAVDSEGFAALGTILILEATGVSTVVVSLVSTTAGSGVGLTGAVGLWRLTI